MYVKYATTLLKNWLLKNGCLLECEASTGSLYFTYGDIEIRLGNHLPREVKSNSIYIMVPQNSKFYGLFVDRSFLTFNCISELKDFLSNLFIVLNADYKNKLSIGNRDNTLKNTIKERDKEIDKLKTKVANQASHLKILDENIKRYKEELDKLKKK